MKNNSDMIDEIMDNFDFLKVHNVMKYLNWTYAHHEVLEVPNEQDIRRFARSLLKDAIKIKGCVNSGGFEAKFKDDTLSLRFIIEDYFTYKNE